MSVCNQCDPCTPVYSQEGCTDIVKLSCVTYNGPDIDCLDIKQSNKDTGLSVIQKIATAVCDFYNGGDDKFVRVSETDTTSGYAEDKIKAGTNISIVKSTVSGNELLTINNTAPVVQSPDLVITSNDGSISKSQTGVKGHTVDLGVIVRPGNNGIIKTPTGLLVDPEDWKVKASADGSPDFLINKIKLLSDPLGIVIPQAISLEGDKVAIGYTINLNALCSALNANSCIDTPEPCGVIISDLTSITDTSGNVAITLVYTGSAVSFRYIVDNLAPVEVTSNPFTLSGIPSGSHVISVQGKCADGTYGLSYQELFNVPFATTPCPSNIAVVPHLNSLDITWDAIAGASYVVELRSSPTGAVLQSASKTTTSHSFSALSSGSTFYIKVLAIRNGITSTACPNTQATTIAAPSCSAIVSGLAVTSVNANGDASFSWTTNGVSSEYKIDNGTWNAGTSPLNLTGQTVGTHTLYVRGVCANTIQGVASQVSYTIPVASSNAFFGVAATNTVLTQSQIEAGSTSSFTTGENISINYPTQGSPKYYWMAEPATEQIKTKWYTAADNYGNIGTNDDTFGASTIVGPYRFYITEFTTQFTDPVQFQK